MSVPGKSRQAGPAAAAAAAERRSRREDGEEGSIFVRLYLRRYVTVPTIVFFVF
jgi:hypothetical protein